MDRFGIAAHERVSVMRFLICLTQAALDGLLILMIGMMR